MPVRIPDDLPAIQHLQQENVFVMTHSHAVRQDIRPLRLAIINLMPNKEATETQLLRLIGNSPIQVDISLLHMASHHTSNRHTSAEHLQAFYKTFNQVRDEKFDGLIITGAPIENLPFEQVDYWQELQLIMDWADHHVYSTLYICWAAQAGLYHHYGIPKYPLDDKISGVFEHRILMPNVPLLRGFDEVFWAPHSRNTQILKEDVAKVSELDLLAESQEAGVYIVTSKNGRHVFVAGHAEYDAKTLLEEYRRDCSKGLSPQIPRNYFPEDNPDAPVKNFWRAHAHLLFSNWLNYYVYQETPYNIDLIE